MENSENLSVEYDKLQTNQEKILFLRRYIRKYRRNKNFYWFAQTIRDLGNKPTTFGRDFELDLVYFVIIPPNIKIYDCEYERDLNILAVMYGIYNKEETSHIVHKYARILRKDKNYPDSRLERFILDKRRKRKSGWYGFHLYEDLAFYMYN